jgi:hypothetical protein
MDVAVRRSHSFRPDGDSRRLLADDSDVPEVFRNSAVDTVRVSTERVVSMKIAADADPVEEKTLAASALSVGRRGEPMRLGGEPPWSFPPTHRRRVGVIAISHREVVIQSLALEMMVQLVEDGQTVSSRPTPRAAAMTVAEQRCRGDLISLYWKPVMKQREWIGDRTRVSRLIREVDAPIRV